MSDRSIEFNITRVFQHFNPAGRACPVCDTRDDKPTVLIKIDGTEDGHLAQAIQVHADCALPTNYNEQINIIYRRL